MVLLKGKEKVYDTCKIEVFSLASTNLRNQKNHKIEGNQLIQAITTNIFHYPKGQVLIN